MDPQVGASFIPKKSLAPSGGRGGGGLFYLVAIFIFVVSLVAAGAAFAYTQYLKSDLARKTHSLELAQGAYEPGSIQDLVRLDQRIIHAKTLLSQHIAPSAVFALLANETLEKVQLNDFSFTFEEDSASIKLGGVADSFSTVALQSDQFGASRALSNVVFSNITVVSGGYVTFSVEANIDPSILRYSSVLSGTPLDTSTPAPTESATTTP